MQMQAGSKRWVPSHTHPLFEASDIETRRLAMHRV